MNSAHDKDIDPPNFEAPRKRIEPKRAEKVQLFLAEEEPARLAAIVESSDDAIISKTLEGVITSWNEGAQRIYGYSAEEAVGRQISMLVPPERPDEVPEILEKMRRGDKVEHYKTVRVTRDGRRLDISLTVSPIKDAQGNVVGGSAIARDITEREEAERRLREAETLYRTLEDYPTFRQALASLLSHEPDLEVVAQAGSLAQAREMLDRRLDVAVLDLGLPDGDGSELIGELRRRDPGISVLVLSAAMGSGHLDDAVKARADAVLDKVESIPTIAEEVRRLAGG